MKKNSAEKILARIDLRVRKLAQIASERGEKFPSSDRAISLAATGSPETLRGIRRNVANGSQSGVSLATISKFADYLETTDAWLLNETGPEERPDKFDRQQYAEVIEVLRKEETETVPLVGYVGAGAEAHFYAVSQGELDRVPAPMNVTKNSVAVEVRGSSIGAMFAGWLVYYDDVRSPITADMIGRLCVVGLSDGRVLVKKVRRSKQQGRFDLLSENEPPIEAVTIEWAAKVKQMAPQ